MKKILLSTLLLSAIAGIAIGTNQTVSANTTATNATTADTVDNNQLSAATDATVNFKAGTLSLYNVKDAAAFNTTNTAFSTQAVWTNGLSKTDADQAMSATVDDFLGKDSDTWTLNVKKGSWIAGTDGSTSGATALDAGAHLTIGTDEVTTSGITYGNGTEGHNTLPEKTLSLAVDQGTLVKSGAYTNNLTWTLSDDALATQN